MAGPLGSVRLTGKKTPDGGSAGEVINQSVNAGEDPNRNVTVFERRQNYQHLAAVATTVVLTGEGVLGTVNVTTAVATSVISVYDGLTTGSTLIAVIDGGTVGSYTFDVLCSTGITVAMTTAAADVTVGYK